MAAQDDEFYVKEEPKKKLDIKDDLIIDFNFLLQFGNVSLIGGNPQIGYRFGQNAIVGGGYNYVSQSFLTRFGDRITDRLHGPTVYASVGILEDYFIRTDYQWLTLIADNGTVTPSEFLLNRWLVGAGYRNYISDKVAFSSGIYFDINSPLILPLFRTGIEYSFGGWY